MISVYLLKYLRLLPLGILPVLAWLLPGAQEHTVDIQPEKVNLALRRTADGLLRLSGDSTSRIPAVKQTSGTVWEVQIGESFDYGSLPAVLQSCFDLYSVQQSYEVAVRKCGDATIDLGYHQLDFIRKTENGQVPCGGRPMPEGCHYIEVSFLENEAKAPLWAGMPIVVLLALGGVAAFWFYRRKKATTSEPAAADDTEWLGFGNSRLDVAGQTVECNGTRESLTFREAKLLRLFVTNTDKLLERDMIMQQVWADEGILVGRSMDVFVSRLRKKIAADTSVGIVAVHGVGYRLETGKA